MTNMLEEIQKHSEEFDILTQLRHDAGAEEYGPLAFLENNMFAFAYEEFADTANYVRFNFIKLRLVEEKLRASGIDLSAITLEDLRDNDEVPFGASSFSPSEKIQGFLPSSKQGR